MTPDSSPGPEEEAAPKKPTLRPRLALLSLLLLSILAVLVALPLFSKPAHQPSAQKVQIVTPSKWTTFHRDNFRDGYDSTDPHMTSPGHHWTSPGLDGSIYAEPLAYQQRVFVATENNSIYALNDATGTVIWRQNLGSPVPKSALPCGNVDPVGITSTPVINSATGTLYALAFLSAPTMHYQLYAINTSTGDIRWQKSLSLPGFDPAVENQRSALMLTGGHVIIPFGGRYGDCGAYKGYVVSVPQSGSGKVTSWVVPSADSGSGIWAPAGESTDDAGNLYVSTGNSTTGGATYNYSEGVIKLSPDLRLLDYWAPANWQALNSSDLDLGPIAPVPVSESLVFMAGKAGDGYLLNAKALGHEGGATKFTGHVCPGLTEDALFGGAAFDGHRLYLPCLNGVAALNINTTAPSFAPAWQVSETKAGSPIVAGGLVWDEDYGANTLLALDPATGAKTFSLTLPSSSHFASLAAARGQVFAAAGNVVVAVSSKEK